MCDKGLIYKLKNNHFHFPKKKFTSLFTKNCCLFYVTFLAFLICMYLLDPDTFYFPPSYLSRC